MRALFIWFVIPALVLTGCPVDPEDGADNNEPTNNVSSTNNANNQNNVSNTIVSNSPNNETNNVGTGVEFELVPLEWGLFGPDYEASGYFAPAATEEGGRVSAALDVRPGAYALRVFVDGTAEIDTSAVNPDRLGSVAGNITGAPFFVPTTTTILFEAWEVDGAWRAEAESTGDSVPVRYDANVAPAEAGRWFDAAQATIAGADDPGGATVQLMNGLRQRGGPLHTEDGVLFIAPAQDGEAAPQIRGTWNDFDADPASELRRITPGFWARFIEVPPGRHEYKIYYPDGDTWVTDISNPHINWDGINPGGVGEFNSVLRPEGARTVWLPGIESPQLGNARDVYVHLPDSYDGGAGDFATLYIHDGNESIVRSQFHIVADETAAADPRTAAVLVFVALASQNDRIAEYTPDGRGDDYVTFLADTLVPIVDSGFRTRTDRTARGLMGSSLGGLISYWGAMQHPDTFGYTAGMSSTFWWPDQDEAGQHIVLDEIANLGCQDVTYYLDSGSPADNFAVTQVMRDTLDGLGCDYDYVLDDGAAHEWPYWRERFAGVLMDFADLHGG